MTTNNTTKKDLIARMDNYIEWAGKQNPHVVPTKEISSGSHGRAFEVAIKKALGNYRSKDLVAMPGKADTIKKFGNAMVRIEIKSGCGELAQLDAQGNICKSILDSDVVIFCPYFIPKRDATIQSYVMPSTTFYTILKELGLIRFKKSTAMTKAPKEAQYYDRMTIQSFRNSAKKYGELCETLDTHTDIQRLDKAIKDGMFGNVCA